jgi:pimeloyl-ACP methyl ester carboxylesterase
MPYGTIEDGQMYVQFLTPATVRHQTPVVLVHGGTGQMLHYMGNGDGLGGWAHYYAQEGYRVYLVDRPGHGRAPYHPDSLGPIGPQPTYEMIASEFSRAAGAGGQWPGTGAIGDPLFDQFMASQNAAPQDDGLARKFWAARGAQLLDRIGPAVIQTHSAGGPFGWLVANQRPSLVKAIVCVEGATLPVFADADRERMLASLRTIPVAIVTAERSGRTSGPVVDFFRKGGVAADDLQLKNAGLHGNGHFMMLENNRRQVFDVIRGWVEKKAPA